MKRKQIIFLPCPHCGGTPEISYRGTCIDVNCCTSLSVQKSDHLDSAQRDTWDPTRYMYSEEAEQVATEAIANIWNARFQVTDIFEQRIATLEAEKAELEKENSLLNDEIFDLKHEIKMLS